MAAVGAVGEVIETGVVEYLVVEGEGRVSIVEDLGGGIKAIAVAADEAADGPTFAG